MYTGFVQSLEFLKKSRNLPSNFSDLGKVWKIELKSRKNGKKSWVFVKVTCTLSALQVRCFLCVCVLVKSYSFSLVCFQRITEKALFLHSFSNLEYGKRSYCIAKSLEKVLQFGSKNLYEPCVDKTFSLFKWLMILQNFVPIFCNVGRSVTAHKCIRVSLLGYFACYVLPIFFICILVSLSLPDFSIHSILRHLLLEYGTRNYCFGKSLEKGLEFGSKNLYEPCNQWMQ